MQERLQHSKTAHASSCVEISDGVKTCRKSHATSKKSKHKTKKVTLIFMKYWNVNKKGKISLLHQAMNAGLESSWPASLAVITVASAVSLTASTNWKTDRKKIGTGKKIRKLFNVSYL